MRPTERFSNRVENYIKYRPGYPPAILDTLRATCGLARHHVIADIGSGTGILAEIFLNNGNAVNIFNTGDLFITVVDGDLCYGFGDTFDETACTVYPEGSTFVVPGGKPHFGVGRSDAVYQESGVGPSAFVPVPAK